MRRWYSRFEVGFFCAVTLLLTVLAGGTAWIVWLIFF